MKKDFKTSGGLSTILGENKAPEKAKVGRPKTSTREITKSSQEGTKENETRATFIVKEDLLEELKAVAYWERDLIKNIVNNALGEYVERYKKKNGELKAIPNK